jgi:hypothetical protein
MVEYLLSKRVNPKFKLQYCPKKKKREEDMALNYFL